VVLANAAPNGVLLALHVIVAIYFALGVVLATIFTLQVPNTPTLPAKARVMANGSRVALTMIIPGALLAGILGIILAFQQYSKPFNHGWIVLSLVLFIAAVVVGGASGPISARTRRMVEAEARSPKVSDELLQALRSPLPLIFTGLNLLITIALIVVMFVQKPQ
jgi:uncharacterized membrane protein